MHSRDYSRRSMCMFSNCFVVTLKSLVSSGISRESTAFWEAGGRERELCSCVTLRKFSQVARQGSLLGMLVTLAWVGSVRDGSILTPENEELILFLIGLDRESNTFNLIPYYLKRVYSKSHIFGN